MLNLLLQESLGSDMYRISQLTGISGLSRSTILYYERLGLLSPSRTENGYRIYGEPDVQRLHLIRKLQAGGLSLKEIRACMEAKIDRSILRRRLEKLDREIEVKQKSRNLLLGLLGERPLNEWHSSLNALAPEAHVKWLIAQGFSEKDALRLQWLSKDMNEHETYMADFLNIFKPLDRWGPGGSEDTLKALSSLPVKPQSILEIGCGNGVSTRLLAEHSGASITAVDNESGAIETLTLKLKDENLDDRVRCICASMTDLPFELESFEVIWAEGCAYIMGVARALEEWKSYLTDRGYLVFSDLVWLTEHPSAETLDFWRDEYPDISTPSVREKQIADAGYSLLSSFTLSSSAWANYLDPLAERLRELEGDSRDPIAESAAFSDVKRELEIYERYLGKEFGYMFFILQKN
jgi:DNA-binding transcriptional MerR regulator/ubiquinone/menaquinone biosynthesis C-methylase UbiE